MTDAQYMARLWGIGIAAGLPVVWLEGWSHLGWSAGIVGGLVAMVLTSYLDEVAT